MKFITARELRSSSTRLWERLPKDQEIIVTLNGKPVALLTPLLEGNFDESIQQIRRAKALLAVSRMHKAAARSGAANLSMDEIDAEVKAVRKGRKR